MEEHRPSGEAISKVNLKETLLMVLARRETSKYRDNSGFGKLKVTAVEIEDTSDPEQDFESQRMKLKRGSTSG